MTEPTPARSDRRTAPFGQIGVWSSAPALRRSATARDGAHAIERLGFECLWYPEMTGGRESLTVASQLLSATDNLVIASGIATIYARDATAAANGARTLEDAYPGRFILGLGVSHRPSVARRGSVYRPPLGAMTDYLDGLTTANYVGDEPDNQPTVMLAALGPKMLALAAQRTNGAHTYFVPVEHTAFARNLVGSRAALAVEQAVIVESSAEKARAIARHYTSHYLGLDNYRRNLVRLGWTSADFVDGGTDQLVDSLVAWGPPETIASRIGAHLEAGATHVCLQPLPSGEFHIPQLERLAPLLHRLRSELTDRRGEE